VDDQQEIYLDSAICGAVQVVQNYLQCDCSEESCPFDRLVRAVRHQEERERREREDKEAKRQEEVMLDRQNESDD
jgi:hypothetical protein